MLGDAEFSAWFRLLEAPGVGRSAARRLLAACGSPERVLAAGAGLWREVGGPEAAAGLAQPPAELESRLNAACQWLQGGEHRSATAVGDATYPPLLLQMADPPLLLYSLGDPSHLHQPSLAMVGSRRASAQGEANARAFAEFLSRQGWVVVSGLAQGIDGAAHEGALQGPSGTVAVVGTGLDRIYPPKHKPLAQRIAQQGCIVSEYAPGTPALPPHFPQRNRIIAGLTRGTLVVEAALQSGSLITARLASEAGREVFAIPGSIHSPQSKGCHALLKQGAVLVESPDEILDELRSSVSGAATARPAPAPEVSAMASGQGSLLDDPLLRALGHDPATLDMLVDRTGWPVAELSAHLLGLELEGRVTRLPGGLFQALERC